MRVKKVLFTLVSFVLVFCLLGSVNVFASDIESSNSMTIQRRWQLLTFTGLSCDVNGYTFSFAGECFGSFDAEFSVDMYLVKENDDMSWTFIAGPFSDGPNASPFAGGVVTVEEGGTYFALAIFTAYLDGKYVESSYLESNYRYL